MKPAVAAEHVIHHQEDQIGIEDEEGGPAERFGHHQIEVGRHHQVADEFTVLLHPDRPHRDFGIAVHVIEETDSQVAGEALVDEFHGRHATADDALLGAQVVIADAITLFAPGLWFVDLAGNPFSRASTSSWERKSPAMNAIG